MMYISYRTSKKCVHVIFISLEVSTTKSWTGSARGRCFHRT